MIFRDKIFGNKSFKLIIWFLLTALIITGLYASQKITQAVIADEKGPFVIYLDVQNAKEFEENGVGVYAYNSASEKDSSVPMEMRPSDMGKGIYEYTFDRKWKYVAFTGGYGSWDYELATLPVNIEWEYNTPCFVLAKPEGTNTRGVWRNLSSTLYFDASLIKDKKVFVENGVYVCAYEEIENSDGLVTVQPPVKMQKSEKGEDIYEYTLDRPYSIVRFILGATTDAEPASELVHIDWAGYASPCYRMSLPASYDDLKPEETSTEESSIEESSTEENSTEESSTEESSVEESSTEESSAEEGLTEESSVEESATEESSVEESSAEESSVDESSIEESSADESSAEGSTVEESSAEESSAKLPTPESSTAEQPSTESSSTIESEKGTTTAEPASAEIPAQPESSADKPTTEEHPETAEGAMSEESEEDKQTAKNVIRRAKSAFTERELQTAYSMTESQAQAENSIQSEPEPASENGTESTSEHASESSSTSEPEPASEDSSQSEPESSSEGNAESEPESASGNSSESTSESASETESEGESNSDTGTSPNGELYDIDANTLVYATLAEVPMLLSSTKTVQTIYFDSEGNSGQGWDTNAQIYVYLFNSSTNAHSDFIKMSESSRTRINPANTGKLWEYTLTDDEKTNYDSAIFVLNQNWSGNANQTQNFTFSGSYPCYKIYATWNGGTDNQKKMVELMGDLGPASMQDKKMYFYDVSGKLGAEISGVKAYFNGSGLIEVQVQAQKEADTERYYVTIPKDDTNGAYDTVQFKNSLGANLSESWNFIDYAETATYGFLFEEGAKDTYYYAATEKADGTIISSWGKQPGTGTGSLSGKTLYFDKLHFPTQKGGSAKKGYLQIGDGEPIELGTPVDDSSTFYYTFPADTTATQQTPLTFIDNAGTKYHFRWTDFGTSPNDINMVTLSNSIASVSKTYTKAVTVYFDATYSKLMYYSQDAGAEGRDYSLPSAYGATAGKLYYYATKSADPSADAAKGEMEHVEDYTEGNNTWGDIYKADLEEGYDLIIFSNFEMSGDVWGSGRSRTAQWTIPTTLSNPCFYADTGDASIYEVVGSMTDCRGGYWDEVYKIRNVETGKSSDVVQIQKDSFTRASDTLYVNTTFYDYYTDYELNGNNRKDYGGSNGMSQRNWVTFRQFDQALSDYYRQNQVDIPIYTGHFQPPIWSTPFNAIAPTLNLYGHSDTNKFYSTNNSTYSINGNDNSLVYSAAQGLVASNLTNRILMMTTGNDSVKVPEPHFDEDFLLGNNSKNAVLGDVYHNVAFPFKLENRSGVKYWTFDSSKTTLAMRQDSTTNAYHLQDVGNQSWSQNVNSNGNLSGSDGVSTKYGFFPFNEGTVGISGKNYNYGFGAKLEFKFRLTSDGKVIPEGGTQEQAVPITFKFAGDDDVWVFIDGNLVLDVGGAHGRTEGEINFADKTVSVSAVKASAGPNTPNTFTLKGDNIDEHTLTMYYMERGMWESNMYVSFNFPDENKLEVEKQVDKSDVNPIFQNLFDGKSIFTYNIKTKATHYGKKDVSTSESGDQPADIVFNDTFENSTVVPSQTGNIFEHVETKGSQSGVAHWFAYESDASGAWRDFRYGIIYPKAGKGTSVDISDMSYLEFKFYYEYTDVPSLSNMYLQIIDNTGKVKGNTTDYLSGKTFVSLTNNKWITIKIKLNALAEETGFNSQGVTAIKFGYNFPRNIYLDDFIFKPETVVTEQTGFVVKQYDIPDYGSAESQPSEALKIPEGAIYASSTGSKNRIGSDGTFTLQNGEVISFTNQFRRGSYMYLEEEDSPLFETTYTMYEDGQPVRKFETGTWVNNGTVSSLENVAGRIVYDDRQEVKKDDAADADGIVIQNGNNYDGNKPSQNTFVFRSYAVPDADITTTKLRVVFTNKVKTGSLKIEKKMAYPDSEPQGTYTFKVTFTNVGGMGLESAPIETTVQVKAGSSYEITGIPIGTFYAIEEIQLPTDAYLSKVEVNHPVDPDNPGSSGHMEITDTRTVEGHILDPAVSSETDTATFTNTFEPKISVKVVKNWKKEVLDANGNVTSEELPMDKRPTSILIRLQRKQESESDEKYTFVTDKDSNRLYEKIQLDRKFKLDADGKPMTDAGGNPIYVWEYTIDGLDKVVGYPNPSYATLDEYPKWVYRFVEIDASGNVLKDGDVITLTDINSNNGDYEVTNGTPEQDAMTSDYANTITNTLLGPVNLKVKKMSMQSTETLPGVQFVLTKWNGTTFDTITGGNQTTSDHTGSDKTTGGEAIFSDLENGTYKLTELKTAAGFTLLKESMIIVINRTTGTFTYRLESEDVSQAKNLDFDKNTRTITFNIKNAQNIVLPATGWNGLWKGIAIISAMVLMAIVMLIRDERKRRRRRLRQRRRREGRPHSTMFYK